MNITLMQPYTGMDVEPPKSLAYIAAVLDREGHKVRLIDCQIHEIRDRWEEIFKEEPVDMVGVTAMTTQVIEAHEIAKKIKTIMPDVPIILGGIHATLLPKECLQEFPGFDLLVLGEGENAMIELASKYARKEPIMDESIQGIAYRSNNSVIITKPRPRILNLDSLPNHHSYYDFDYYLKYNTLDHHDNAVSMIVSRGCPYRCTFCATKNFWTLKYINQSTDSVIGEIRYVMGRGGDFLRFRDSTFTMNKKWVRELCEKMIKERLHIKFAINTRVDHVDYELFKLMKKAGLSDVYFGVESGSQRVLDFYGKGITLKQTEEAFKVCKSLKIRIGAYYMLGVLTETREEMEATYQFAKKLKADVSLIFLFMPLPGCELYDYYKERGYTFDWSNLRGDRAFVSVAGYSKEELVEMKFRWWHELNNLNPRPSLFSRSIVMLLDIRSFRDVKRIFRKVGKRLNL